MTPANVEKVKKFIYQKQCEGLKLTGPHIPMLIARQFGYSLEQSHQLVKEWRKRPYVLEY